MKNYSKILLTSLSMTLLVILISPQIASLYAATPSGYVYENSLLRIGVDNYGALGFDDATYGWTGFQYPVGGNYESIATGWIGDGWSLFYGSESVGFAPDDGVGGSVGLTSPSTTSSSGGGGTIYRISLKTTDNKVEIIFTFHFFNNHKFITLETTIKNIGSTTLNNLEYKRIVDWDVWRGGRYTSYNDYWGMDDVRKPSLHLTVAFVNSTLVGSTEPNTVYMGFASIEKPTDYDHDWDDYMGRGLSSPEHFSLKADGSTDYLDDYAIVYDWLLGNLKPGKSVSIHQVFAAGDSLDELERNVKNAFSTFKGKVIEASGIAKIADVRTGWKVGLSKIEINTILMDGKITVYDLLGKRSSSYPLKILSINEYDDLTMIKGYVTINGEREMFSIIISNPYHRVLLVSEKVFFTGK